ncbi:hypothetical protein ES703_122046 [subsurface metagenome]
MAKIGAMPSEAIISGFKGTLDFYVHDGQPCVRKWPRSPGHARAPAVEAQWAAFSYASQEWNNLSQEVRDAYDRMSETTALSGRDWFMRSYLSGIYRYPTGEPED